MINKVKIFVLMGFIISISSCYNDNEEDIYIKFNAGVSCDTTNITYDKNMKTFFNAKCASCHDGSQSACNLNNYNNAHNYAIQANSNLYTTVAGNSHKNCVLTACEDLQLKLWIENGAQ